MGNDFPSLLIDKLSFRLPEFGLKNCNIDNYLLWKLELQQVRTGLPKFANQAIANNSKSRLLVGYHIFSFGFSEYDVLVQVEPTPKGQTELLSHSKTQRCWVLHLVGDCVDLPTLPNSANIGS